MTTPQNKTELEKAIEEVSRVFNETTRHENCRIVDESTGVSLEMWAIKELLSAAKELKAVTKESYDLELSTLKADYKQALEALSTCRDNINSQTFNLDKVSRVLSLPSAIAVMNQHENK